MHRSELLVANLTFSQFYDIYVLKRMNWSSWGEMETLIPHFMTSGMPT